MSIALSQSGGGGVSSFSGLSGSLDGAQMPTTFETAGIGWFNSYWGFGVMPPTGGSTVTIGANKFVYGTLVLYPITVRKIVFAVDAAVAASKVYVAIYDSTGTLVANSSTGGVSTAATGIKSTTLGTPVTINPGFYYIGIFGDTAAVGVDGAGYTAAAENILNANVSRIAIPTNGISGSAVPGTLGALTPSTAGIFHLLFES